MRFRIAAAAFLFCAGFAVASAQAATFANKSQADAGI
jgi:hypothetical protein